MGINKEFYTNIQRMYVICVEIFERDKQRSRCSSIIEFSPEKKREDQ